MILVVRVVTSVVITITPLFWENDVLGYAHAKKEAWALRLIIGSGMEHVATI